MFDNSRLFMFLSISALLLVSTPQHGFAQGRGRGPAGPPPTPEAGAPEDLTGYWVSIVTEDWRYRI